MDKLKRTIKLLILLMGILSFLGLNGQNNEQKNSSKLTSELQSKYRKLLQRNPKKNFSKEFIRTTDLENELVNRYGFDAIKLIYEFRNSENYHLLGSFPEDCPWSDLDKLSISKFIDQNFKSLSNKIPNLLSSLKERCKFIYAEKKEGTWYLHYFLTTKLYDKRDYFKVFIGGSPLSNPAPNENLRRYKWSIPTDLKKFYLVHNGFGELYDSYFISPNSDIKVMAEVMVPISKEIEEEPDGYTFEELLEFFPDGGGNVQCFYKKDSNKTVDWDHETWELSYQIDFFEFIDQTLSKIDEE